MAMKLFPLFTSNASGYDDCGITEVFDCGTSRPTFNPHDYARDVAYRKQHILAGELSRLDAAEYQLDILDHMMRMDAETLPDVDSIDIQTEIQWFMRPYLLDFLVEAHSAFQLLPETLFLAVNLLDRYCSKRVVYKRHYQLVGCAALLIAAKYGDKKEKVPTIKELKSMCCSLYDDDMFLQMEWHVLSTLDWTVGHPTVDSFLKLAVKDSIPDPETENLALYILEMALFHRDFVSKPSSTLALAALALSRHVLGRPQPRLNEYASQYCETTLVELSRRLHQPSEILSRKYASGRYAGVSRILTMFLAEQAAIAEAAMAAQAAPPSPCEHTHASKTAYVERSGFSTPTKPQLQSTMRHGYPTPPITPEGECFGKDPQDLDVSDRYTQARLLETRRSSAHTNLYVT